MRWRTTINNTPLCITCKEKKEKMHMSIYFDADRVLALFFADDVKGLA